MLANAESHSLNSSILRETTSLSFIYFLDFDFVFLSPFLRSSVISADNRIYFRHLEIYYATPYITEPTDALMELYRELGYGEKADQGKMAQLNRSLRNFLLRQKQLPSDVVDEDPSQARSLAEEFCATMSGDKTNAEIFWPLHTASGRRQPMWPQDKTEYNHLNFRQMLATNLTVS
jgi:hypothetical protein